MKKMFLISLFALSAINIYSMDSEKRAQNLIKRAEEIGALQLLFDWLYYDEHTDEALLKYGPSFSNPIRAEWFNKSFEFGKNVLAKSDKWENLHKIFNEEEGTGPSVIVGAFAKVVYPLLFNYLAQKGDGTVTVSSGPDKGTIVKSSSIDV